MYAATLGPMTEIAYTNILVGCNSLSSSAHTSDRLISDVNLKKAGYGRVRVSWPSIPCDTR